MRSNFHRLDPDHRLVTRALGESKLCLVCALASSGAWKIHGGNAGNVPPIGR
jgi:hypothetical protein